MTQTFQLADVIAVLEAAAPPCLQEEWDNTGWQIAYDKQAGCTGVLICLDVTENVINEAVRNGCNLIISHHPLIYRGLKSVTNSSRPERLLVQAVRERISIYSSHTALDSAPMVGLSHAMALKMRMTSTHVLVPGNPGVDGSGLGVIGRVAPASPAELIEMVKKTYHQQNLRYAGMETFSQITEVALCTGAGGEFIPHAIKQGAQAYITSDVKYHDFLDYKDRLFIIDTGHYESEICARQVIFDILKEKMPNFALRIATTEQNPVKYV